MRFSYSAISWLMAPVWMAEELGLFKKHGLDVQLIYIPIQSHQRASVAWRQRRSDYSRQQRRGHRRRAGCADRRRGGLDAARAVCAVYPSGDQQTRGIEGQSHGRDALQFHDAYVDGADLEKLGLENFVSVRQMGDVPAMHRAFEQRIIAGMVSSYGPKARHHALTDAVQLEIPYAGSMMTVTRSFLQDRRETVEHVLRAYIEGMADFLNKSQWRKKCWKVHAARPTGVSRGNL